MVFENLEFRILQKEDFDAVWKLILAEYLTREPCCVALNLDEEKFSTVYLNLAKNSISHQASLGAFDKQTKELIGINLTLLAKKRDSIPNLDLSQLPKEMQQYGIMLKTLSGEENLVAPEKFMGTKNYMQSTMLCSKTNHGNKGLGTELYKRSEEIALEEGCEKRFTFSVSAFTSKICDKMGYESLKDVIHKDYIDPITGDKIFENVPSPHTKCSLMSKNL